MTDPQRISGGPLQLVEQRASHVRQRTEDEQALRAERELEIRRGEMSRKFEARRAVAQQPALMQAEVLKQYDAERASVEERLNKASRKMRKRYRARLKAIRKRCDCIRDGELTRFAAQLRLAEERVGIDGEITALRRVAMGEIAVAADQLLAERGIALPDKYEALEEESFDRDNCELFTTALKRGEAALAAMRSLKSVRLAGGRGVLLGFVGFAVLGAVIAGLVWGISAWQWIGGAAVLTGTIGSLIVNRAASPLARKQTLAHYGLVRGALADAQSAAAGALADVKEEAVQRLAALAEKRDRKIHQANAARSQEASTTKATLERKLAANAEKVAARLEQMHRERDSAVSASIGGLPQRLAQLEQQQQAALATLEAAYAQRFGAS